VLVEEGTPSELAGLVVWVEEETAPAMDQLTSCEIFKNLCLKWGKLPHKKNFPVVHGDLPSKEWVDLLGQTAWGPWQVEKNGVAVNCMKLQYPQGNACWCFDPACGSALHRGNGTDQPRAG
jgi:hypothetical protein